MDKRSTISLLGKRVLKPNHRWIKLATEIHGDTYDYCLLPKLFNSSTSVQIICPKHGLFDQTMNDHVTHRRGCSMCSKPAQRFPVSTITQLTQQQNQIANYLQSLNVSYELNKHVVLHSSSTHKFDLFLPNHNIAIQYYGIEQNNEQVGITGHTHVNLLNLCGDNNIELLTIFEDEWLYKQSAVKQILRNKFTNNTNATNDIDVVTLSKNQKDKFFNKHHINGTGRGDITLGLKHNNQLIAAIACFEKKEACFVNRFAATINPQQSLDVLLSFINQDNRFTKFVVQIDRRWNNIQPFESNNFVVEKNINPDYSYSYPGSNKRVNRFNFRMKILETKLEHFDPKLNERQNCDNNNMLRVWDCGKLQMCRVEN